MRQDIDFVLKKLEWMENQRICPNGKRYLWTDAFGLVLFISLYDATHDYKYIDKAVKLINNVDAVLGMKKGYRIGEEQGREGQYFHYLSHWIFALTQAARVLPEYKEKAINVNIF